MQQREAGFFQFFQRYPEAVRHDYKHRNGHYSTVSVGLFQGQVDGAFIGIYDETGRLRSEVHLPWELVENRFGRNIGPADLLSTLTEIAATKAGSPIAS